MVYGLTTSKTINSHLGITLFLIQTIPLNHSGPSRSTRQGVADEARSRGRQPKLVAQLFLGITLVLA